MHTNEQWYNKNNNNKILCKFLYEKERLITLWCHNLCTKQSASMIKHGRFANCRRLNSFFFSMIDDGKANFCKQHVGINGQTLHFTFIPLTVTVCVFSLVSLAHRIEVAAVMHSNEFWGHVLSETNLYELLHLMCCSFIDISKA